MECSIYSCKEEESEDGLCLKHLLAEGKETRLAAHKARIEKKEAALPSLDDRVAAKAATDKLRKKIRVDQKAGRVRASLVAASAIPTTPRTRVDKSTKSAETLEPLERCTFPDCTKYQKQDNSNGLCPWHRYHQLVGLELEPRPYRTSVHETCHWPAGCGKPIANCGFCSAHKAYLRSTELAIQDEEKLLAAIQAKIEEDRTKQKTPEPCLVKGCEFPAVKYDIIKGLCGQCLTKYREWFICIRENRPVTKRFSPQRLQAFELVRHGKKTPT